MSGARRPWRSALLGAAIAGASGVLLFISLFLDLVLGAGRRTLLDSGLGDVIKDVGEPSDSTPRRRSG